MIFYEAVKHLRQRQPNQTGQHQGQGDGGPSIQLVVH